MGGLVHEAFQSPVGPAWPHGAQPTWPECRVGEVIVDRPDTLRADRVPVVRAIDREGVVADPVLALGHEERRHGQRWPAGRGGVVHRRDPAPFAERHPNLLDRRGSRRVKAAVVGAGEHQLHRLADGLRGQGCADGVVAVQSASESAAEQVAFHDDLVFGPPKRLRQPGQDQRLPLIAGVNFPDAVFFERQGVHRLKLEVQGRCGRVGRLHRGFRRCESRIHARIFDHKAAHFRVGDQFGRTLLQVGF